MLANPEVAYRPCEDCLKYMYDHSTGRQHKNPDGTPKLRPPGTKAPCQSTVNAPLDYRARICPKISPDGGVELSEQNRMAYEHYHQCRAVGHFPDDPIVRQNARIIRQLEDRHEMAQMREAMMCGSLIRATR